jgi:hypothetical protein
MTLIVAVYTGEVGLDVALKHLGCERFALYNCRVMQNS